MAEVGIYYSFPGGGIGRYNEEWLRALAPLAKRRTEYLCLPEYRWDVSIAAAHWPGLFSISSPVVPFRRAKFLVGQVLNPRRAIYRMTQEGGKLLHFTDVNHLGYPLWRGLLDRSDLKMVITAHDIRRQVAVLNRGYEDEQLKEIYNRVDCILVHAESQKDDLQDFAGVPAGKVVVVPHGPYSYGEAERSREEVRRHYGLGAEERVGLCFGQLRDEKNLEGLIRALAREGLRSKLLITGKAGNHHRGADWYRNVASEAGVSARLVFDERFIPDKEVADLVVAADWIGVPYRRDFTSMSGVLNLACHYHRPVLCGPAPALAECVNSQRIGEVAQSEDAEALAAALTRLETRLNNGEKFMFEKFLAQNTWEENARRTLEVYDILLDK